MEGETLPYMAENNTQQVHAVSLDWLVFAKDPRELWSDNWFALVLEVVSVCLFLRICIHAKQRGTRSVFLVASLVFSALSFELFQHLPRPGYQLWWYHQGILNFFDHRAPLYVICLFTVLYYCIDVINIRMNLPVLTQSLVNAVCAFLLILPCLRLAPNLLLVMVHFDDPIFLDRIFTVPYTQLTTMLLLFFHSGHVSHSNFDGLDTQERHFSSYFRWAVVSGVSIAAYSIVEVYLLHMVFTHILKGHIGLCMIGAIVILGVFAKDELQLEMKGYTWSGVFSTLGKKEWLYLLTFFLTIVSIPILVNPENLRSNGERLEFGPCDVTQSVSNMSPLEIVRRRYVCPNDTAKFGFGFHCVQNSELALNQVKTHYTICGAPYEDPVQLSKNLFLYSLSCLTVFYAVFSFSIYRVSELQQNTQNLKKVD